MSNVQNAKTARVDLLDDKKSIILTIGAADKTVTKFELTNDAASQLVSMMVWWRVMRRICRTTNRGHATNSDEQYRLGHKRSNRRDCTNYGCWTSDVVVSLSSRRLSSDWPGTSFQKLTITQVVRRTEELRELASLNLV